MINAQQVRDIASAYEYVTSILIPPNPSKETFRTPVRLTSLQNNAVKCKITIDNRSE